MKEMKKTLIEIFDSGNLNNEFKFSSSFSDGGYFKIICDRVRSETGIDLSSFSGTETQKDFNAWSDKPKSIVSNYIVNELRIKALKEKMQTERLTEEDEFELHYYEEFGEYASLTPDNRKMLIDLENMHSKSISELSEYELETLIEATNFKLQNVSKLSKENHYDFEISYYEGITPEAASRAAKFGEYLKPIKPGIYLMVRVPDPLDTFSKVSGIDIRELYEKINIAKTEMEIYLLDEQVTNIPNCHLLEYRGDDRGNITDCDLNSCKTVYDFETTVMRYSELFARFISGQKVKFDSMGNELSNEDNTINIETQVKSALQSGVRSGTISELEGQSHVLENEEGKQLE